MKDSWAEYDDGGIALRCYFLERVSRRAPVVLERLRPGLACQDYHELWCFLKEWSRQCHVDTDWFRLSGEFTVREWRLKNEVKELVLLGERVTPVTVTFYPQLESTESIRQKVENAIGAAGLEKSRTHQTYSTRRRVAWLIRHDVLEEPTKCILRKPNVYETKFYAALREIRERLGIPQPS